MQDLLFLCHRIPFPPDKGDKIRSYQFLRHLSRSYRIHLACQVDDKDDLQHLPALSEFCCDVKAVNNGGLLRQLKALPALARGLPLSVGMFSSGALNDWVRQKIVAVDPVGAFIYSSAMSQFMDSSAMESRPTVMDFVDVDSEKWLQYSKQKRWLARWLYGREARTLLAFDRHAARNVSRSLFVSEPEAELFRLLAPESADRVYAVKNGIDLDVFTPDTSWESPYTSPGPHFVFTGSMDYWPNVDAVTWFASDIFPLILAKYPTATFYIVGARPTSAVRDLAVGGQIYVTGRVDKVQPYLSFATAAVAPLRIARGIQNKVLEAMAMGKATIVTPDALEGIDATPEQDVLLASEPADFVRAAVLLHEDGKADMIGKQARLRAENDFGWPAQLAKLDSIIPEAWLRDS